jgi:hypothetical protein
VRFGPHPLALYGLAQLWYHSPEVPGFLGATEQYLKESLDLDPSNEWARMTQSLVFFEEGRFAESIAAARMIDRARFLAERTLSWRALKLDELEIACRARLGERVEDEEWRDLVQRYRQQTVEHQGPIASPREAIQAAEASDRAWVAEGLRAAVARPRID